MGVSRFNATKLYPGDQLQILGVDGYKVLVVNRASNASFSRAMKNWFQLPEI